MDGRPKVLLIEDDPVFLQIVSISLDKRGYEVASTKSFEDGLEALEHEAYSFVMTDIFMPGIGGIEGIKALKTKYPKVPVVAISGGWADLSAEETIEAAQKIGADAGVKKPIKVSEFEQALITIGKGAPFFSTE